MATRDIVEIILLVLLAVFAIRRWIGFFKAKKKGEEMEYKFSKVESIITMILILAFASVALFWK